MENEVKDKRPVHILGSMNAADSERRKQYLLYSVPARMFLRNACHTLLTRILLSDVVTLYRSIVPVGL